VCDGRPCEEGSGWLVAKFNPPGWCNGKLHAREGIRISVTKLNQTIILWLDFRCSLVAGSC
jgi:hypothetical protein